MGWTPGGRDCVLFLDSGDGHMNVCLVFFKPNVCCMYICYISQFKNEETIQIIAPWQVHMTKTGRGNAWRGSGGSGAGWLQLGRGEDLLAAVFRLLISTGLSSLLREAFADLPI